MTNQKIRDYAKKNNVHLWEIANKMNLLDCNFSRKLRKELSKEESQKVISIIDEISKTR